MPIRLGGYKVTNAYFCGGNGKLYKVKKGYFGNNCIFKENTPGPTPTKEITWVKLNVDNSYDTLEYYKMTKIDYIYVITNGLISNMGILGEWQNHGSWEMIDDTHTYKGTKVYIYSSYGIHNDIQLTNTIRVQDWGWDDGGNKFAFDGNKLILSNSLSVIMSYLD